MDRNNEITVATAEQAILDELDYELQREDVLEILNILRTGHDLKTLDFSLIKKTILEHNLVSIAQKFGSLWEIATGKTDSALLNLAKRNTRIPKRSATLRKR